MADYKAIADQLRGELGRNPTGTEILARAKAPKVSDDDVRGWLNANPNATDAEIATAAKQAGVSNEQLARVTQVPKAEVDKRVEAVETTKDKVSALYDDILKRDADDEGLNYWTDQINSGALTLDQVKQSIANSPEALQKTDGNVQEQANVVNTTASLIDQAKAGDIGAYGQLLYLARQSNTPVPVSLIESIGYSRTPDKEVAYNYSVGAQAIAEGYEALDKAIQSGDTETAQSIQEQLANPEGFWNYYNSNIADNEGQAHINLRKETADGNPFEVGDPGEYQTSFFEGIGDLAQDIIENPVFKMAFALNPATAPFAPFLSAVTTKLSGDEISGLQVAGMLASAPGAFSQASTLAGTQYDTGFLSPQSIELATQQVGLEPNWLTLGQDVSSGITTESDLLRGAQQGGVMAGATALGGGSDLDIAKAFANQQMIDLGGLGIPFTDYSIGDVPGMLSGIEIPGLNIPVGDLPDFNIPGLNLSLAQLESIRSNLPDFNLPTYTGPDLNDINYDSLNNLSNVDFPNIDIPNINIPSIDLPSTPDFNFNMQGPSGPDINIDIPFPDLPEFAFDYAFKTPTLGIDPMDEIAKYLYPTAQEEEDIKLSEVLLRGAV